MAILKYTGKNVLGVFIQENNDTNLVRLLPGINEVEEGIYDKVKAHPLFQSRLKLGLVTRLDQEKSGKQTVEQMLSYVPEIYDVKLLRKLIQEDGRAQVIQAAKEQLERIRNPKKASEEEKGEHFS